MCIRDSPRKFRVSVSGLRPMHNPATLRDSKHFPFVWLTNHAMWLRHLLSLRGNSAKAFVGRHVVQQQDLAVSFAQARLQHCGRGNRHRHQLRERAHGNNEYVLATSVLVQIVLARGGLVAWPESWCTAAFVCCVNPTSSISTASLCVCAPTTKSVTSLDTLSLDTKPMGIRHLSKASGCS